MSPARGAASVGSDRRIGRPRRRADTVTVDVNDGYSATNALAHRGLDAGRSIRAASSPSRWAAAAARAASTSPLQSPAPEPARAGSMSASAARAAAAARRALSMSGYRRDPTEGKGSDGVLAQSIGGGGGAGGFNVAGGIAIGGTGAGTVNVGIGGSGGLGGERRDGHAGRQSRRDRPTQTDRGVDTRR